MNVSIVLDRVTGYNEGETVSGRVLFMRTAESLLAKPVGLKISLKGECSVRFTLSDWRGRWRTHAASEIYFNSTKYLVGNGTAEVEELSSPGLHEYPFSYRLPCNLPASYKGTHGEVAYTVTTTLKRSWGINKEVSKVFYVQPTQRIQLRQLQQQQSEESVTVRKTSKIGMLWWGGTLSVNFNLKKKSYVPGDNLNFSAQIVNDSHSKIHKVKLLITQECRYLAEGMTHTVTHILKKLKGPGVGSAESTVTWESSNILGTAASIPPLLCPTNLGGPCNIIQINYFAILIVQPSTLALKERTVTCKLPLTLGTKRQPTTNQRQSYPSMNTSTNSLAGGSNRVGSCGGTIGGRDHLHGYYQNVVFPLNRCFSAPVYENYRFTAASPIFQQQQGFLQEEEEEDGQATYEPPPTYEEAMCRRGPVSTILPKEEDYSFTGQSQRVLPPTPPSPTPTAANNGMTMITSGRGLNEDVYQNGSTKNDITNQPIYNNY